MQTICQYWNILLKYLRYIKYLAPGNYGIKWHSPIFMDTFVILSFNIQGNIEHV